MTKKEALKKFEKYEELLCLLASRGSLSNITAKELIDSKSVRKEVVEILTRGLE